MKRLIAAALLLLAVFAVYVIGSLNISKTCKASEELLDSCLTAYENGEDAGVYCEKLEKLWEKREKTLSIFTNHAVLDEMELSVKELALHVGYADNKFFYDYHTKIKMLIHQIKEDNLPGVLSIA